MAPNIETIDKLPLPLSRERVSQTDRVKAAEDQEAFKRALKRKLGEEGGEDEASPEEAPLVELDLSQEKHRSSDENDDTAADTSEETEAEKAEGEAGDREELPDAPDHIDLKA